MAAVTNKTQEVMRLPRMLPFDGMPNGLEALTPEGLLQFVALLGPDNASHTGKVGELICPSCFTFEAFDEGVDLALLFKKVPSFPDSIKQVVLNLTPSHLYYSFAVGQCEVLLERSWMAKVIEPPAGVDPFNLKANASSSAYRSTMKGADTREKTRKAHLPVHLARACVGVASQMSEVIREVAQGQKFAATFDNELDVYALFMSCCMEGFDIAAVMKLVTDEFFSRCSNSGKKQNCSVDVIMRRLTPLPLFNKKESIGGHADIYCLVSSYKDSYLKTIVTPLHVPDDAGTSSSFELRGVDGVCGYALGMFIFEMYNTLFRRVALVCSWIRRVEVSSGKELTWTDSEVKQLQDHLAAHEPFDVAEWQADKLKSRGNDVYKNSDWTAAADAYTQAISMAPVHSAIRAVCLVNRATVRLTQYQKLPSLSKADTKVAILGLMEGHRDCTSAISGDPMYWKAYHRRMQIALALARMPTLTFTAEELADAIASSSIAGFDSRGGAFLAALADAVAVVQYSSELRDVAAEAVLSAIDEDLHDSYVRDIVESPPQVSFNCHATLRLFSQSLVFPLPCYPGGVGPRGMLDAGLSSDLLGLLGFVRPHPLAVALVNMVQPMRTCRRTMEPVTGGAKLPGLSDSDSTCETAILWGQNALTYYPKEFGPGSPWRQAAIEGLQSAGAAVDKKASTLAQLEAGAAKVKSVTGDSEQQQQQQQQQQNKATNKSKGDSSAAATQAKAEAAKTAAATEAQKKKEAAEAAETKRRAEEKRKADEKTAKAEERKRAEEEKRKAEELARQKQRERDKEEALKKKEAARKLREEQEAKKKEEEEAAFRRLVELEAAAAVEEELRLKRETEDAARAKADAKSAKTKKVTTPATAPAAVPSKAVSPVAEGKTTDFPDAPVTPPSPATEARPPQQPQQRSGSGKPTAAQPKANPSAATPLTEDSDDEEVQARRLEAEARRLRELAEAKKRVKEQQQGATAATKPLEVPPVVRQHSDPTPTAPPKSGLPLPRSAQTASATSPLVAATSPPQTTTPEPTQTKTPSGVPLPRSQRVAAGGMDKSASSSPPSTQEVPAASSPPSTAAQVVNVLSNLVPSARVHGPSTTTELKGKRAKDANGNGAVTVASPPPPSWQEPPARSSTSFTVTAQEDNMESRQLSGVSINDSSPATPNVAGPVLLKGRVKAGNNQNATANAKTTTAPPQAVNPFTPHASASFAAPVPVGAEAPRSPAVTTTTAASTFTMKAAVTTSPAPPPVGAAPSPSFLFDTSSWAPTNGPTQAAPSLSMFANNFRSTTAPKTELPASWQAQPLLQLNAAKPSAEPRRDGEGVVEFDFDLARVNFSDFM